MLFDLNALFPSVAMQHPGEQGWLFSCCAQHEGTLGPGEPMKDVLCPLYSLYQGHNFRLFCRLEKRGFILQEASLRLKSSLHLMSSSKVSSVHYNLQCNFCSAAPLITSDMGTEECHCSLAMNNDIRGAMRKRKMDIKKAGSCLPIISSTN